MYRIGTKELREINSLSKEETAKQRMVTNVFFKYWKFADSL